MTEHVILMTMQLSPDRLPEFEAFIEREAPLTRSFEGCELFEIYTNGVEGEVLFLEHWRSEEHAKRYAEWRSERGDLELLGSFFTASPTTAVMERIAPAR
jgi:quinol monooxygenase YgiN